MITSACTAPVIASSPTTSPLAVGTSGDYPPFSVLAADGTRTGFDIEVGTRFARETGREVEWVPFRWPDLLRAASAREFDVAMSGVTVRPERVARFALTRAVARADAIVVALPGAAVDLDASDVRIAVNRGGHLERVARGRFAADALRPVDDNRVLEELLVAGRVDAVVTDSLEAASFSTDVRTMETLRRDRKAYLVTDPDLEPVLDRWLADAESGGSLGNLRMRHLGGPGEVFGCEAHLLDLVSRRLMIMPLVAEAKRVSGAPVDAPEREASILARAATRALGAGLDEESARRLAEAQFAAAKRIQRAVLERPPRADRVGFTLGGDLRPAIDRLDRAIFAAFRCALPIRGSVDELSEALHQGAFVQEIAPGDLATLARVLSGLRLAGAGQDPR